MSELAISEAATDRHALSRSLTLPLALLFGLGVTIGAGIYVLIGATVGHAGAYAPLVFIAAALVMAPTAAAFAELAVRFPVSAGEAAYVEAGFSSRWLGLIAGCLVIVIAVVSAAAITRGSAGYIQSLVPSPLWLIIAIVVLVMGGVAAWGIVQSASLTAVMTLIEIIGIVAIIAAGFLAAPDAATTASPLEGRVPTGSLTAALPLSGFVSATLLAFFAFVGFEGLANIAEEVKDPARTLPRAMGLTLAISTLLYILVAMVALRVVPQAELAASPAPLSLVYERATGASPLIVSLIAVVSTVNGIVVQIVMAARVLYGMASRGLLPPALARVNATTHTPLLATGIATTTILALALSFPLERLAETTSRLTLVVFALVNAALIRLKTLEAPRAEPAFRVPLWVPVCGLVLCLALLLVSTLP